MEAFYIKSLQVATTLSTRSSKRTDLIHRGLGGWIHALRPDLRWKTEFNVSTHLGSYNVDLTLFNLETPVAHILVKAPLCNIKQNITNTENSCLGEIVKLYSSHPTVPIVMVDFIPTECPYYSEGAIKHMEKFSVVDVLDKSKKMIKTTDIYQDGRPLLKDRFVMFPVLKQESKQDITFEKFEEGSEEARLKWFILSL